MSDLTSQCDAPRVTRDETRNKRANDARRARAYRQGIHIDMATVPFGQLWDQGKTVAQVTWGDQAVDGRIFGTVLLKTGAKRTYYDPNLIDPYVKAWNLAKAALTA